jgi:hypothetical protein
MLIKTSDKPPQSGAVAIVCDVILPGGVFDNLLDGCLRLCVSFRS